MPRWSKGTSGNPGGRPRAHRRLRDLCVAELDACVTRLRELRANEDGKISIAAINTMLAYAVGKPASAVAADDKTAKLQESELQARAELAAARAHELDLEREVEQLRAQVADLVARASVQ